MRILIPILLFLFLVATCKKYKDPKFIYDQPILELLINNDKIFADSSKAHLDTMNVDSTIVKSTSFYFWSNSQLLLKIRIGGRSIGSYEVNPTSAVYYPSNDTFWAKSGKVTVWQYDTALRQVSADLKFNLESTNKTPINIQSGTFVRCPL
jgi:hypothetical protein